MTNAKVLLVAFITLMVFETAQAQRHRKTTRSRYHFSAPKVRRNKAKIICPTFDRSKYPFHGFGFKLGDPFALTYKYYPNKRFSLAVDFGMAASGLYNTYFREKFDLYVSEDTISSGESTPEYVTHRVKSDLVAELKVLYHLDAEEIAAGLQGYAGVGWQWRSTRLHYDFEYPLDNNTAPPEDPFGSFERNWVTMGPQFVLGIEYAYFKIPIAAFMEVEYFTDIQADPGWQRFEGGIGLRYIF